MNHLKDTKILFLAKHIDHVKKLALSSKNWSVLAFSGPKCSSNLKYVLGEKPSKSSKPFFENLEFEGLPDKFAQPTHIWSMEPYRWQRNLDDCDIATSLSSDYYLFQSLNDKFGLFSELLRLGSKGIQSLLRSQFSNFEYQFSWSPNASREGAIVTTHSGVAGEAHTLNNGQRFYGVTRSSKFCDYEFGVILQTVVFDNAVVHGPIGRTWSGQAHNIFRNVCIYYQDDFEKLIDMDRLYELQTEVGNYLHVRGFRGAFSTDWLSQQETKELFLLEINPRFSSDLCLFDRSIDSDNQNIRPLGLLHALATSGESWSQNQEQKNCQLNFSQMGGGENKAYYPPNGSEDKVALSLRMAPAPEASFFDQHANLPLLQALGLTVAH